MTIAKMGLVICDMVDIGMVQVISSTGALMAHGLIEGVGLKHYKHNPAHTGYIPGRTAIESSDRHAGARRELQSHRGDRRQGALDIQRGRTDQSQHVPRCRRASSFAADYPGDRGILKSTFDKKVPVLCPAFVDSEIGNDLYVHNERRRREGKPSL